VGKQRHESAGNIRYKRPLLHHRHEDESDAHTEQMNRKYLLRTAPDDMFANDRDEMSVWTCRCADWQSGCTSGAHSTLCGGREGGGRPLFRDIQIAQMFESTLSSYVWLPVRMSPNRLLDNSVSLIINFWIAPGRSGTIAIGHDRSSCPGLGTCQFAENNLRYLAFCIQKHASSHRLPCSYVFMLIWIDYSCSDWA